MTGSPHPGEVAEDMSEPCPELSSHELSRIIDFLRKLRAPFDEGLPGARPDTFWNVTLELIDAHLHLRPTDKSALIAAARVPYGTGNRMIGKMIEDSLILQVPRGPKHKTSYLAPSEALIADFTTYALHVKGHLAKTFGLRKGPETNEYYFGGSYFASHIISPLNRDEANLSGLKDIRFLLNDDNYFAAMRNLWSDFRNDISEKSRFDLRILPELYQRALTAFASGRPEYDIVGLNMPWLGEFASRGDIAPLDEHLEDAAINPLDFHPSIWGTGNWGGRQYGIPLYCTVEILAARKDLFAERRVNYPRTFDDTVEAAREFHQPSRGFYGIAWNGHRGMPIASSFMLLLASADSTIIEFPRRNIETWDFQDVENVRLTLDTDAALEVIDYMRRLIEFSPPDISTTDWEKGLQYFMSGRVAMTYCWTMRAARFEHELSSRVTRRVAYLPPPALRGSRVYAPVGGFLLTIPSALPAERRRKLIHAIAWMASPEAMKAHVKNGFPVAPRFSVCADPEAMASSPIVSFVDKLARRNELVTWARPPIPEYTRIERVLGEEIYAAVFEAKPARKALLDAEAQIYKARRERGNDPSHQPRSP